MSATDKAEMQQKEEPLKYEEAQDGSLTVEGIAEEEVQDEPKEPAAEVKADAEEPEQEPDGQDAAQQDEDHEDDTEAIREAKRARRRAKKQFQREQQKEKDLRFNQILRQNQELMERLKAVETKTHGSEMARIDKAIEDQEVRINYAKMKIAEATQSQDGNAMTEAQDLLYESRRAVEALTNLKRQASQPKQRPMQGPDPIMQRYAADWMDRNSWYDPGKNDEDSAIAFAVDERLAKEGWDPRTHEYWEELDNRLQKRLPHRYTGDADDKPVRKPRSVVTGSGRESVSNKGGKNSVVLSREQVQAMKDAGFWEDPLMRDKMIRRYANEQRKTRS